ncbi:hypothetical protein BCR34DRAFT_570044 [Clohesyomyces aquaticus]|uniref:GPI anchored cell wall protein n=1 Tax=Clohesyomyces aquaticus TaxID=1231657 RepID=A0A1Y1ZD32_9PLEO|nr:hypothetical protein BCR34DRAFT_570044 [Clohesyomyces aquaticus]
MKTFTSLAAFVALASAATVTITETKCLQNGYPIEQFTIEVDQLVVKDLPTVCGLHIVSASGVDVTSLTCRAYKDAAGTDPGSAFFNSTTDALIATNPVQEGSIRCNSNANGGGVSLSSRSTTLSTAAVSVVASTGTALPIPTGNATISGTRVPTVTPSGTTGAGAPNQTGAAAHVGSSILAVMGAFAVFLL